VEVAGHVGAVCGAATGDNAGWEVHGPRDVLFHFVEAAVVVDGGGVSGDAVGLFAGEIAAGVEGVNADVVERAAAGEGFAATPLAFADVEAEGALDGLDLAEVAVANELDGAQIGRLIVAAIGDHQFLVCGLAGGDHLLAVFNAGGHGLFTEHVLAGLGGADGVLGVHGVGERDVDGIDSGVVRDLVERFVAVDGTGWDVVLGGDLLGLVAMAADEGSDLGVGGVACAGHEVAGDPAEADDGVAGFLLGGLSMCGGGDEMSSGAEGGEAGEVSAGEGHWASVLGT